MKTKKEIVDDWVTVANLLAKEDIADLNCPVCRNKTLKISEEFFAGSNKFEIHITCLNCKGSVSILKEKV